MALATKCPTKIDNEGERRELGRVEGARGELSARNAGTFKPLLPKKKKSTAAALLKAVVMREAALGRNERERPLALLASAFPADGCFWSAQKHCPARDVFSHPYPVLSTDFPLPICRIE